METLLQLLLDNFDILACLHVAELSNGYVPIFPREREGSS